MAAADESQLRTAIPILWTEGWLDEAAPPEPASLAARQDAEADGVRPRAANQRSISPEPLREWLRERWATIR